MSTDFRRNLRRLLTIALAVALTAVPSAFGAHATGGTDVKVTADNNNDDVASETPNPSFDKKSRQSNETTVAVSPADPDIVVIGANDYRMVPVTGDVWLGFYVSADGGATWFNTMVPGFPSDTSAAGINSPLKGLDAAGDPTVRFDAAGNLYVAGIAFNRNFDQVDLFNDNATFVAKYLFTPGSAGGTSTPNSAANPPNFAYAFTTVVDRGAVGFAVPAGQPFGFAGKFDDKNWLAVDTHASSPCFGAIYFTFTRFTGVAGAFPIVASRSTDGGASFSEPVPVSQRGQDGSVATQGSDIAVAPNGTVYVGYRTFKTANPDQRSVHVVKSTDCGKHWGQPVVVNTISAPQAPGVAFRTPSFAFIATDDTDSNTVYVAYQNFAGTDYDIFVQRSTNGGVTWGSPVQVNADPGDRHQIFPTIAVSHHALHVAWYDFRNSTTSGNEALDVFYACTNCAGNAYPTFSHDVRVSDVSHQPNCRMFGGGRVAFHGDYIELDARFDGGNHIVDVAWADNRDVPAAQCDLSSDLGPDRNSIGNSNQNIYADELVVSP